MRLSDEGIRRRREVGGSVDRAQEKGSDSQSLSMAIVAVDEIAPRLEIKIEIENLLWLAAKREREKCRGTISK